MCKGEQGKECCDKGYSDWCGFDETSVQNNKDITNVYLKYEVAVR